MRVEPGDNAQNQIKAKKTGGGLLKKGGSQSSLFTETALWDGADREGDDEHPPPPDCLHPGELIPNQTPEILKPFYL